MVIKSHMNCREVTPENNVTLFFIPTEYLVLWVPSSNVSNVRWYIHLLWLPTTVVGLWKTYTQWRNIYLYIRSMSTNFKLAFPEKSTTLIMDIVRGAKCELLSSRWERYSYSLDYMQVLVIAKSWSLASFVECTTYPEYILLRVPNVRSSSVLCKSFSE